MNQRHNRQIAPLRKIVVLALMLAWLPGPIRIHAQLSTNVQNMIRRINSGEFGGGGGGQRRWIDGGRGYATTERGEFVRYDTATGQREVLMSAKELTPPGLERALSPGESSLSNSNRMLFATNPRTVMVRKTANDYWVLDKARASWHKLGGKSNSDLLYAKLSPDGSRAAYVRGNDLYVENIGSGAIMRLTSNGSDNVINGTSDWVNEEEFYIRDAFEWSPDGKRIAFLQFDQSDVPEFTLINYTETLYPALTQYRYPKPGQ